MFRKHFSLVCHLVARDFRLRYTESFLGVIWSILIPLAQLGVLVFTFGTVVRVDVIDYPVFVYTALLPWTWFSSCLGSAGHIFFSYRDLVRRPNFPPAILAVVNTASNLLTFLLSLPLLLILLEWYGRDLTFAVAMLPFLLIIQALMTIGLSLIIATWNVFFRDVGQLVNITLALMFFLTPIFYRPVLESKYSFIFDINPVAVLLSCYRAILFEGQLPPWESLILVSTVSIALFGLGYVIYRYQASDIVDVI